MHYFTPKRCVITSKIMYHDKLKALRAADRSLLERGEQLWVYRCQYCGSWHLTSHEPGSYVRVPFNQELKKHTRRRGYKPRHK